MFLIFSSSATSFLPRNLLVRQVDLGHIGSIIDEDFDNIEDIVVDVKAVDDYR